MKYTALTIGPVIRSLSSAHRTKELWAASYFFSFLMKQVIIELNNEDAIVIPKINNDDLKMDSAGIYPDRLILRSKDGLYDNLNNAIKAAIKIVSEKFNIKDTGGLERYLNMHITEFEDDNGSGEDKSGDNQDGNFIFRANKYLANCELQSNYEPVDSEVFLKMLQRIDSAPIYKEDVFKGQKQFPSIIEIATRGLNIETDLQNKDDEDIWDDIVQLCKNGGSELAGRLKLSHKYIAIVHADGDNIGNLISELTKSKNKDSISEFSIGLSQFALNAVNIISEYGGEPIYAGGDDLLFFAPVINNERNIFTLINDIDEVFKNELVSKYDEIRPRPSMSYGISISYYKFPMHEALGTSRNLLFNKAKNFEIHKVNDSGGEEKLKKNAIAFKIMKHSGQSFEAVLHKPLSEQFEKMLSIDSGLEINSVIYNLEKHKTILKEIIDDESQTDNFFENFYNEQVHKTNDVKNLLDLIKQLLSVTFMETKDFNITLEQVYAQLRAVKFIKSKYNE